jgi:hypothetical protein
MNEEAPPEVGSLVRPAQSLRHKYKPDEPLPLGVVVDQREVENNKSWLFVKWFALEDYELIEWVGEEDVVRVGKSDTE